MAEARRRQRGAIAVEAAYLLPVIIVAAMMFMELANIGLTINIGANALERAVQQFRRDGVEQLLAGSDMAGHIRERMAAASHGHLVQEEVVDVEIESFANLDEMGGGGGDDDGEDDEPAIGSTTRIPAWRISVGIRKQYITPLPRLLGVNSSSFSYRYQQVLSYLPQSSTAENIP